MFCFTAGLGFLKFTTRTFSISRSYHVKKGCRSLLLKKIQSDRDDVLYFSHNGKKLAGRLPSSWLKSGVMNCVCNKKAVRPFPYPLPSPGPRIAKIDHYHAIDKTRPIEKHTTVSSLGYLK